MYNGGFSILKANQDERYAFIAEWYDPHAALIRRYQFLYYTKDQTLEMVGLIFLQYDIMKIIALKSNQHVRLPTQRLNIPEPRQNS